ncbi:MAG: LacI family DNA-binding transcriptional regulator [Phycisphaerales bacterium]|nr:LacI family DNA-binding transcriptional regulator [Phycisphaerales bacterium]
MKDIASDLQLSPTTVCYALGNNWQAKGVSPQTRQAVIRRSRELGFRRNRIAAGLSTRTTHTIGVLVPRIADMYADMLQGVEAVVGDQYSLLLGVSQYEAARERKLLESFEDRMVDGLIVVSAAKSENLEILMRLHESGVPMVQADRYFPELETDIVEADGQQLTRLLTEHLLELGHQEIAYLVGAKAHLGTLARQEGYEQAMADRGLKSRIWGMRREDRRLGLEGMSYGRQRSLAALSDEPVPTAVVAHDEAMAVGCVQALQEHGLSCPEDVSVAGVGRSSAWMWDNPMLRMRLTCASWSVREMGRLAAGMLMGRLQKPRDQWPLPQRERLSGEFVAGGTTSTPRSHIITIDQFNV